MNKWRVILAQPDLGDLEIRGVSAVLKSKWLTMGELSRAFEMEFAGFIGARYAVFVNSCTAGLHLACRALGIGPRDEVICPSLTFVATSNAILYVGAKPVFADIAGIDDLNISVADIEDKITSRTKAIIVVHYAGFPCAMDKIKKIADKFNLFLIEDAAHAIGASFKGISCGMWSDIGVFSFYSNKNMTTAEGGMLVTNNASLMKKLRLLRSHGMTANTWDRHKGRANSYDILDLGYNYRPTEIGAALGLAQLKKIKKNNQRRKLLSLKYRSKLSSLNELIIPFLNNPGEPAYHIFPLVLKAGVNRDMLIKRLKQKGIQTSIHYSPVHSFSYYRKLLKRDICLPNTDYVGKHEVTLPLYPQMEAAQLDYVADTLRREIKYCLRKD